MGSDMYMNPPQKQYETHRVDTEEEAMEWVVGALAMNFEVTVSPFHPYPQGYTVRIFKGVWI